MRSVLTSNRSQIRLVDGWYVALGHVGGSGTMSLYRYCLAIGADVDFENAEEMGNDMSMSM